MRSSTYTMDNRLEDTTHKKVLIDYDVFLSQTQSILKKRGFDQWMKKYNYDNWPLMGDGFENPPFNTIKKIDSRTILRKGSLATYFIKRIL